MDWFPENSLDYGPVVHGGGRYKQGSKRNLLWPVYAWRVMSPEPRERTLNILQRAVLRFYTSGLFDIQKMAEYLVLEEELIQMVRDELKARKWLTTHEGVTPLGYKALSEDEYDLSNISTGWVFQDSHTGKLLPRFVKELKSANIKLYDNKPFVEEGSKGAPKRFPVKTINPGRHPAVLPSPQEILTAAYRHSRNIKSMDDSGNNYHGEIPTNLECVSTIDDRPEPMYLKSFIYSPEVSIDNERWLVAEPFGFGASEPWRKTIEDLRKSAEAGYRNFLDNITGQFQPSADVNVDDSERWIENKAIEIVEGKLVSIPDRLANVKESLVNMTRGIVKLHELGFRRNLIHETYLPLRQSWEMLLNILQTNFCDRTVWQRLSSKSNKDSRNVNRRKMFGFLNALSLEKPDRSFSATKEEVQDTCNGKNNNLSSVLKTLVLTAALRVESHPVAKLSKHSPSWLRVLRPILRTANKVVHNERPDVDRKRLEQDVDATLGLCAALISFMPRK